MQDLLPINAEMYYMADKLKELAEPNGFFPLSHFDLPESTSQNVYLMWGTLENPVAFGMLRGWDEDWEDKCLGVFIVPKFRGLGYGELLCLDLIKVGQMKGLKRIRLHVSPKNTTAIKLYKKLGFKKEGIRENGEEIWYLSNSRGGA